MAKLITTGFATYLAAERALEDGSMKIVCVCGFVDTSLAHVNQCPVFAQRLRRQ